MDAIAVDASRVVMAVHLNHMKVGGSHQRSGSEHNKRLGQEEIAGEPRKFGKTGMSDVALIPRETSYALLHNRGLCRLRSEMGQCPACGFARVEQPLALMLAKHAVNSTVVLVSVGADDINQALNWACAASRVEMDKFLFYTDDDALADELRGHSLPVVVHRASVWRNLLKITKATQSPINMDIVLEQGRDLNGGSLALFALRNGMSVLMSRVDALPLRNVLFELQGTAEVLVVRSENETQTTQIAYLPALDAVITALSQTLDQSARKTRSYIKSGSLALATRSNFLMELWASESTQNLGLNGTFSADTIVSGKRFFEQRAVQRSGSWPYVVIVDHVQTEEDRQLALQNVSLWWVDEESRCIAPYRFLPSAPQKPRAVVLKVFWSGRLDNWARVLDVLEKEDCGGFVVALDFHIDISVTIDQNGGTADTGTADLAVRMARNLQWRYGPKAVVVTAGPHDPLQQRLQAWYPSDEQTYAVILEDDLPWSEDGMCQLILRTVSQYTATNVTDPRVLALALPLRSPSFNESSQRAETFEAQTFVYRHQLIEPRISVLFPAHWSEFLAWSSMMFSRGSSIPSLGAFDLRNSSVFVDPFGRSAWAVWLQRFALERGYYAIWTVLGPPTTKAALEAAIVEHQQMPLEYRREHPRLFSLLAMSRPLTANEVEHLSFPPVEDAPLYDYDGNPIALPVDLEGRALYSDLLNMSPRLSVSAGRL